MFEHRNPVGVKAFYHEDGRPFMMSIGCMWTMTKSNTSLIDRSA
jgi:hypothetical protein